ncbi:MAG: hypothetical protein ACPGVZ_09375 [Myxococcota bacterium]
MATVLLPFRRHALGIVRRAWRATLRKSKIDTGPSSTLDAFRAVRTAKGFEAKRNLKRCTDAACDLKRPSGGGNGGLAAPEVGDRVLGDRVADG